MKILQFAFDSDPTTRSCRTTTRSAASPTPARTTTTRTVGWFASASRQEARFALRYLHSTARNFVWELIRGIWSSVAVYAIAPMQDMLDLGTEARMNYPSRLGGNWHWRMQEGDLSEALTKKLRELNYLYWR